MGKAMCTDTAREMDMLRRRLAGTEAQLKKATQNMRLLEDARREAFKDGYIAALDNHTDGEIHISVINQEMREAMMLRGYVPLDA